MTRSQPPIPTQDPEEPPQPDLIEVRFQVEPACAGWRLDRYLQHKIPRLSRTRIARIIREISTLNGSPVRKPGVRVGLGDQILILRPAPVEPPVPRQIEVAAEGAGYLAINKPAGLPVHPSARYLRNTLTEVMRERFGADTPLRMAHRLDRETSGLVLFGTNAEATRRLKAFFRQGRIQKTYLAIVQGVLRSSEQVDAPIGPAPGSSIRIRMGVVPGGHPAVTRFVPVRALGDYTLVEAHPRTGRQHQIRVHLEALGLHLVGDKLYGHPDDFFLELVEQGLTQRIQAELLHPRHALHAARLSFPLPDGSERPERVEAPLAEDLRDLLTRLGAAPE